MIVSALICGVLFYSLQQFYHNNVKAWPFFSISHFGILHFGITIQCNRTIAMFDRCCFFQSKHPHVIYTYNDKSPQGCAVSPNFDAGPGNGRKKRDHDNNNHGSHHHNQDHLDHHLDHLDHMGRTDNPVFVDEVLSMFRRAKRDVRTVQKFIEVALVLDKAMVSERVNSLCRFLFNSLSLDRFRSRRSSQ